MVQLIALLAQTHMKHTHITHPPFIPLFGALVCSRTFWSSSDPRRGSRCCFPLSFHYFITSACVYEVGRGPSLGRVSFSRTKGSLPFFLFNPCMLYTTEWGLEARLQILDCAHLQRLTNDDDRKILSGSADVQWGTWFPRGSWIALFANLPTFPPNQSTGALLNVNKVFMLLTQSEG